MTKSKFLRTFASVIICAAMTLCAAVPAFADISLDEDWGDNEDYGCTMGIALPGDANSDGATNVIDAIAIVRSVAGHDEELDRDNADTYNDGVINTIDAIYIVKYVTGYENIRLGHKDVEELVIEPSCGVGEMGIMCEICGSYDYYELPATGEDHTFAGGFCAVCGTVDEVVIGDGEVVSEAYTELKEYLIANDYFEGALAPYNYTVYLLEETVDDFSGRNMYVDYYDEEEGWGETLLFTYEVYGETENGNYSIAIDMDTGLVSIAVIWSEYSEEEIAYKNIVGFSGEAALTVNAEAGMIHGFDCEGNLWEEYMTAEELAEAEAAAQEIFDSTVEEFDALLTEASGISFADLGLVK